MTEFIEHWEAVDALAAVVLPGGQTRGDLMSYRTALQALRDGITDLDMDLALARATRDIQVEALQARVIAFNTKVRGLFAGTALIRALPEAFAVSDGETAVNDGLHRVLRMWGNINGLTVLPAGLTLPMLLPDGTTRAELATARDTLRAAYQTVIELDQDLKEERGKRNDFQETIYATLKAYRLRVAGEFPAGHSLVDTMPALTPTGTRTPDAVVATGVWDAGEAKAQITWEASADSDLARYEVRGVPGEDYVADDEVVLATVLPEEAREVLTGFALGTPGLKASFKVYVVLHTGHERGSEAVMVQRPV